MRNPLNKRIIRSMKANIGKYIGISAILIVTIVLGSAFMAVMDSAVATVAVNDVDCRIEDGQFETNEPLSEEIVKQLEAKDLELQESFYYYENSFEEDTTVLVFDERKSINLPSLFEGSLPQKESEIAVERIFANVHKLKVGDKATFGGIEFTVSGIMAIPDYSSLFKNNQDMMMNTQTFGVAVVSEEGFERFSKDKLHYRYAYRWVETLTKTQEREKIEDMQTVLLENQVMAQNFMTQETNQAIKFLREDMGKDGPVMKVLVYIFILIIAFVFAILTDHTIESESIIIGTLRSLGYKKWEVIWHYLSSTVWIALASSVLGNVLGYTVGINPFLNLYYSTYSMAPVQIRFNLEAFVTTTILPVVIMIVINAFMIWRKLSLSPLKFLRKDLKRRKQKKAVKLPAFSFLTRFRLRVLLQNKWNYLMLVIGVFLSSFLLMFAMGMQPLFDHYVEEIGDSLEYEYQYILKAPVEVEDGEKLQAYNLESWYEFAQKNLNVSFMGVEEETKYFTGLSLPKAKDEVVISRPLADKLGLKVGDVVTFTDTYYEKEYELKVVDVYEYKGTLTAFMERDALNEMLGYEEGSFNSYLSEKELDIEEQYLAKQITREDLQGAAAQMMSSFSGVMGIVEVFSIAVYMILMYILTKTVIEKNALSISFLKVFGYGNKEVGKLYLNATTYVILVSLVVCIPLEAKAFEYVLVYLGSLFDGHLYFYAPAWLYVALVVIGIGAYFVINTLHLLKIRRIPMTEALKNRE